MLLVMRVFLLLGFAFVLPATSKGRMVKVALSDAVSSYLSSRSASNIANLSLSPWTYIESVNSSHLPMKISQANCSTSGCRNLQGGAEDATLEAKPIKYQVLVLYKTRNTRKNKKPGRKNKYVFLLGTEEITVGCTCVRPNVIPQG